MGNPVDAGIYMARVVLDAANRGPIWAWVGLAASVVATILGFRIIDLVRHKGRTKDQDERSKKLADRLTILVAAIVIVAAATGMWRFFGEVMHIDSTWARLPVFAVFELTLVVCGIRARYTLRQTIKLAEADSTIKPTTGIDGKAMWVFAALQGLFTALDSRTPLEGGARFVLPIAAAWLVERGLTPERRKAGTAGKPWWQQVNWRITPERIFVRLALAEASGRGVGEVDRERRIARLANLRVRVYLLDEQGGRWAQARARRAKHRLAKQVRLANEHLGLATDRELWTKLQQNLATNYAFMDGTSPDAVAKLVPWTARPIGRPSDRTNVMDQDQPADPPQPKPTREPKPTKPTTGLSLVWSPRVVEMANEIGLAYPDQAPSRKDVLEDPRFKGRKGWSSANYVGQALKCLAGERNAPTKTNDDFDDDKEDGRDPIAVTG